MSDPTRRTFEVVVCQVVERRVVVEVNADDEEGAIARAVLLASDMQDSDWSPLSRPLSSSGTVVKPEA